jgi:hypothetical protein
MITRPKVSSLLPAQVPEFVREDYTTFVEFLKAYYEFLDQNYDTNFTTLRDLDKTLDTFIDQFKNELAINVPYSVVNERFLLEKIKDQYLAKGSEASFKLLFKILFNKQVTVDYPSRQILRASDGKWNQDVGIFARVNAGNPDSVVGKIVDVVTSTKILRVQVDKRQYVEVEVDNIVQISDDVYEFFIDRRFFGDISIGDSLRYGDTFDATIVPTTSRIEVQKAGKRFKIGDLYSIKNGEGAGSVVKISRVDTGGGIQALEFVKYGIKYTTDFTANLIPISGLSANSNLGSGLTITGGSPSYTVAFSETTDGFYEQGIINTSDYTETGEYWDGTYSGQIIREFYVDNKYTILDPDEPAIIKVTLGALAKYPGYYTTNDGFLDDAIFIQDSRYYQAFAYVLKIDERLDKYRSAVKTLIHPAGMALFGEFDIRNEFDTGTSLEFALKHLFIALQDEFFMSDGVPTKFLNKTLSSGHLINDNSTADPESVTVTEELEFGTNKLINNTTSNYDEVVEPNEVFPTDTVGENETRTVPFADISKSISTNYLYDGTTEDDNTVSPTEADYLNADGATYRKGISEYTIGKILNSTVYDHYLNNGSTLDDDTFNVAEAISAKDISKSLNTHYLYDGVTQDTNLVTISDTTGTGSTRSVPYIVLNKSIDSTTSNYDENTELHEAVPTDSGGSIWLSPYSEPYPVANSYFANDSGNYTEGESAFTG